MKAGSNTKWDMNYVLPTKRTYVQQMTQLRMQKVAFENVSTTKIYLPARRIAHTLANSVWNTQV